MVGRRKLLKTVSVGALGTASVKQVHANWESNFQVTILTHTNSPVEPGDSLQVSFRVVNRGRLPGGQEITNSETSQSWWAALEQFEYIQEFFLFSVSESAHGEDTVTVYSDDDQDSFTYLVMGERDNDPVLEGTVVGGGEPLTNLAIEIRHSGTTIETVTTNANGGYSVKLPPAGYEVVVKPFGYADASKSVELQLDDRVATNFDLTELEKGSLTGKITGPDGDALAGAELSFVGPGEVKENTTTDTNGKYSIDLVPATYNVTVSFDGLTPDVSEVTIPEGQQTTFDTMLEDGPPPLPGYDTPPQDLDGDGLFEDLTGTGSTAGDAPGIADVVALFENLESDEVQNHPALYRFNAPGTDDPDRVGIGDVAALFEQV